MKEWTREERYRELKHPDEILDLFSAAVEVPYESIGTGDDPLTRGELAEIVKAYAEPLM